ncbi:hypothetical protein C6503_24410 [Candidatus Poribacteria bacterium]|nr:MAG: hypothetical protein C6503_24410 [Candidatus Poribacteria bacterium]
MQMKTITLPLGYFVLIATFFLLYPFDNAHAFRDQERGFIYEERKDTLVRLVRKNYRGRRKGFIFGLSAGVGQTSFTKPFAEYYWRYTDESEWSTKRQTRSALVTELKIGHGFNDQFLLYYTSRISWLPLQHFTKDTTVANGAAGMGFMLFPFRRIGLYLVGNIGLATLVTWQPPLTLENARQTGVSVSGGIGYELFSHWSIDFTVNSGSARMIRVDDPSEIIFNDEILTFSLNLNMLAY